jgi:hypothetical protein
MHVNIVLSSDIKYSKLNSLSAILGLYDSNSVYFDT